MKNVSRPHLFSAVLSMACIFSSMVDLMRNLCTKVGLETGERGDKGETSEEVVKENQL